MRIIKLSPEDPSFPSRAMVDFYFNEELPNREHNQFLLTKGRIKKGGISPGELLVFSYNGDIVYLGLAESERLNNTGSEASKYTFYFSVGSIIEGKGNLQQLENELKTNKNIVKTRGWPTIQDSTEIKRIWNQFKAK